MSRPTGLKRLKKIGITRKVESSEDQESLGNHEDASKQGRSIADVDADIEVTFVDETQERQDDESMFDIGVLDVDEIPVEAKVDEKNEQSTKLDDSTAGEAVTTASVEDSVALITIEEITLAQSLIQLKAAKPKVVTTAATTTTTTITRHKAKGVVVQEPNIQAKLDAELIEEQKLARKQEEEANIALIESWETTQAMMEADRLLAERLQSKEREELTDEEKGKLFMELMEKRRKHFAALRAQEKRNRPPTKAQKRTQMSTYLKHMGGYTYKQLKGKSFDEIQKLFDKEMKRVNTFVAMGSEVQESKEKKVEGSEETAKGSRKKMLGRKRARKEQQQESSKKQRMEEDKESDEVDEASEDDEGELMKHLVIKKDEDIAIDAIPLATKLPVIIDYKLHKEGMLVHYQLIRADGSSKRYSSMIRMLQGIDREDLEALWKIVKTKYSDKRPEDEFERVLWGDLKVMFELKKRSDVWRILQGYRVTIWKLIDSSRVHFVRRNLKIQKMNIKFRGGLLGLKRLHGFLEVTTAQSNDDKSNETLGAKNNEGFPKQNLNSYASRVKMDEMPKSLEFIPTVITDKGNEVVIFDEELMLWDSEKWCLTVCCQFIGFEMHISELRYNIRRMWGKYGIDEIDKGKNGYYMFKFKDEIGMNAIIEKGPCMVKNKPLFVHKWSPEIRMIKVEPKKMPVWVKINQVPLEAWSTKGISALDSSLGKHVVMDSMTASMCYKGIGNLGYAKVLVEMDAAKELKNEIKIHYVDKNKKIKGSKKVQNQKQANRAWRMDRKKQNEEENIKGKEGYTVKNNKWKVKEKVVEDIRNTANKYSVLNTLPEDNDQELRTLKERMVVDTFLNKKLQPTLRESITWSKDMIDYFKRKWEEMENEENEMEDVMEINNGTTKVIGENEISVRNVSNMQECSKGCRIVVGWDADETNVQVLHKTTNEGIKRKSLWKELIKEKRYVNGKPWCIAGDMNVTLKVSEHSCGRSVMTDDMVDFQKCLNNIEIEDICKTGLHFTWTKNLQKIKAGDMTGILKKLDRVMTNEEFIKKFSNAHAKNMEAKLVKEFYEAEEDEEKFLFQQAKIKWLSNGDKNSNYFHKVLKGRNNRSKILNIEDCSTLFQKRVSEEAALNMIVDVSDKEIKEAMFDIDDSKALGPNGFTAAFFKKAWAIVGTDVCKAVREFFNSGRMLVITNRIKPVFRSLVSSNQSAFIPGRHIQDNIMITQELMKGYNRKGGPKRVAFKIDLQKAYDTINWFTINMNGERVGYFKGGRGLRQDDPMSPYLFTLIMEIFSLMLQRQIEKDSKFQYHFRCKSLKLVHVCFADDLLVMCHGDTSSVEVIKRALDDFVLVLAWCLIVLKALLSLVVYVMRKWMLLPISSHLPLGGFQVDIWGPFNCKKIKC
ncbi:RNA-directed DNA polymerase, eukaryota, reverse transcriptase zinc-binding domain protein [Tanacetum coccineum]